MPTVNAYGGSPPPVDQPSLAVAVSSKPKTYSDGSEGRGAYGRRAHELGALDVQPRLLERVLRVELHLSLHPHARAAARLYNGSHAGGRPSSDWSIDDSQPICLSRPPAPAAGPGQHRLAQAASRAPGVRPTVATWQPDQTRLLGLSRGEEEAGRGGRGGEEGTQREQRARAHEEDLRPG